MSMDRRTFLNGGLMAGTAAFVGGCRGTGCGFFGPEGAPMQDFACGPLARVRVGVVGVGGRGLQAVKRLVNVPGADVTAVCDVCPERLDEAADWLSKAGRPPAKRFTGVEGWKGLCAWDGVDVVYVTTHWALHAPVGVRALEEGKHAMIEVPAAMTLDECWALVEAAESGRRHCMMLENCIYGEEEMLALNMCRLGIFGQLVHGECAYNHEMCASLFGKRWENWRGHWDAVHKGNQYPTHGLGPICLDMDVNRGDRLDHLVSLESDQFSLEEFDAEHYPADDWRSTKKVEMGDMNCTLIKTAKGRSILLQHDVVDPQPYSRINKIIGTKGIFWGMPWRRTDGVSTLKISLRGKTDEAHDFLPEEKTAELRELYKHPLWKKAGEIARKQGGHGGMDYMMDLRWVYCLRNGLPLDMDVYDLATWCSMCELTEDSVRHGSRPVDVPDFTRGAWRTAKPRPLADIDLERV